MKKVLAGLLALVIAMGFVVCAGAVVEDEEDWEQIINSQRPLPELKPDESQKVSVAAGEYMVFLFKPEKSTYYYFYSENAKDSASLHASISYPESPYTIINIMRSSTHNFDQNFDLVCGFTAGETYYLFVYSDGEKAEFDVAVSSDVRKLSSLQWIGEFLTFGMFRRLWVRRYTGSNFYDPFDIFYYADYDLYSIPGRDNWMDNAKFNLDSIAEWVKKWTSELLTMGRPHGDD